MQRVLVHYLSHLILSRVVQLFGIVISPLPKVVLASPNLWFTAHLVSQPFHPFELPLLQSAQAPAAQEYPRQR